MSALAEGLKASKSARLDLKTTEFAKEFIRKAAAISGLDMTSFIMASAFEKAEAVMKNYQRLELSEQAFDRLQDVLRDSEAGATPSPELVTLMRRRHERSNDRAVRNRK